MTDNTDATDFTVDGKDSIEELANATIWYAESMEDYAQNGNDHGVEGCRKKIQEHLDRIEELQSED